MKTEEENRKFVITPNPLVSEDTLGNSWIHWWKKFPNFKEEKLWKGLGIKETGG